jgi:hypothetical protein
MMYDHDDDHGSTIDPELRLHSVRTAASAIAESIKVEQRQERREKRKRRFFSFRRKGTGDSQKSKLAAGDTQSVKSGVTTVTEDGKMAAAVKEEKKEEIKGSRRNIYVNYPLPAHELDTSGDPLARYPRNKVRTTSEFILSFYLLFYLMLIMSARRIHNRLVHPQEPVRTIPACSQSLLPNSRHLTTYVSSLLLSSPPHYLPTYTRTNLLAQFPSSLPRLRRRSGSIRRIPLSLHHHRHGHQRRHRRLPPRDPGRAGEHVGRDQAHVVAERQPAARPAQCV